MSTDALTCSGPADIHEKRFSVTSRPGPEGCDSKPAKVMQGDDERSAHCRCTDDARPRVAYALAGDDEDDEAGERQRRA